MDAGPVPSLVFGRGMKDTREERYPTEAVKLLPRLLLMTCLAAGGAYSGLATFWSIPPLFLGGTAAAGAFALINCVGNLSGFVGPGLMGWLLQTTGSYRIGMWMCTGVALAAALSMAALARHCRAPSK